MPTDRLPYGSAWDEESGEVYDIPAPPSGNGLLCQAYKHLMCDVEEPHEAVYVLRCMSRRYEGELYAACKRAMRSHGKQPPSMRDVMVCKWFDGVGLRGLDYDADESDFARRNSSQHPPVRK